MKTHIQTRPDEYWSKTAPMDSVAQRRAKQYTSLCKRKREIRNTAIRYAYYLFVVILIVLVARYRLDCLKASASTETTRTEKAVLFDIDDEGNFVIETFDGNLWCIQNPPEVYYEVTFDTNGTDDVEDDEIVGLE